MRTVLGGVLLVVGVLAAAWGVAGFVLLTRSPDSDWVNGVLYGGPFLLTGLLAVVAGARLLRRPHGPRAAG